AEVQGDAPTNDNPITDAALLPDRGTVTDETVLANLDIRVDDAVRADRAVGADDCPHLEGRLVSERASTLWDFADTGSREHLNSTSERYAVKDHHEGVDNAAPADDGPVRDDRRLVDLHRLPSCSHDFDS